MRALAFDVVGRRDIPGFAQLALGDPPQDHRVKRDRPARKHHRVADMDDDEFVADRCGRDGCGLE